MTLVVAHRGDSATFRENTLAAFESALAVGADWVELDVRRTADGRAAVHHDPVLDDGRVIVETAADRLPDHVPLLEDVIDACGSMGINIEIKSDFDEPDFDDDYPIVDAVLEAVTGRLSRSRTLISSFDMGAINRVHDLDAVMPTGFLTVDPVGPEVSVGRALAHGHAAVHPGEALVTARFVEEAHEAGLRILPWTVDDPDRMRELIDLGVDGIITNTPAVLRSILDS